MSKKQKCPAFENHERWLVSFADMMTLLFALFVVLFALKDSSDTKDIEQAAGALQESFNSELNDIPADRRVGPNETGFGIFENMKGDSIRQPIIRKFPNSDAKIAVMDAEKNRLSIEFENRLYGPNKLPDPKKPGSERIVSVHRDTDGVKVRLLGSHFYEPGGYRVKKSAMRELSTVAKALKEIGRPISVQGHTDSLPPPGEMSNWDLSSLRATNVLRYFIDQEGFSPMTISAGGYADTKPIANNRTEAGRRLNRRIEILIHYNDEPE